MHPTRLPQGAAFRAAVGMMTEDHDSVCFNLCDLLEVRDGGLQPEPLGPAGLDVLGCSASGHLARPAVAVVFAVLLMLT